MDYLMDYLDELKVVWELSKQLQVIDKENLEIATDLMKEMKGVSP